MKGTFGLVHLAMAFISMIQIDMISHAVTHLDGQQQFWYSDNGNMTQRVDPNNDTWTYTWNVENMLAQADNQTNGRTPPHPENGNESLVNMATGWAFGPVWKNCYIC